MSESNKIWCRSYEDWHCMDKYVKRYGVKLVCIHQEAIKPRPTTGARWEKEVIRSIGKKHIVDMTGLTNGSPDLLGIHFEMPANNLRRENEKEEDRGKGSIAHTSALIECKAYTSTDSWVRAVDKWFATHKAQFEKMAKLTVEVYANCVVYFRLANSKAIVYMKPVY